MQNGKIILIKIYDLEFCQDYYFLLDGTIALINNKNYLKREKEY